MSFLFLFSFLACGDKDQDTAASVDTDTTDTDTTDTDTSDTEDTSDTADTADEVVTVIIGVYTLDEQGNYVDENADLVFEVGVPCYSWTRTSMGHDAMMNLEAVEGQHDHYNAGDETSYVDGIFTWTEYGPEHSQEDIDETCAAGMMGVTKSVSSDDYYEDHNGLYLRIKSVE